MLRKPALPWTPVAEAFFLSLHAAVARQLVLLAQFLTNSPRKIPLSLLSAHQKPESSAIPFRSPPAGPSLRISGAVSPESRNVGVKIPASLFPHACPASLSFPWGYSLLWLT